MTKEEFKMHYGFTDGDMERISMALKTFNGKIISIDKASFSVKVSSTKEGIK